MSLTGATRAYPFAFLLGLIAACGFAPLCLWPLTLVALAALIAAIGQAATLRRAAGLGWWFGLGFFCLGLNWIATAFTYQAAMPAWLGWIAVLLLSLFLALYPALAVGAAWWIARGRLGATLVLAFAGSWLAVEMLRAVLLTGFAWNPIAAIWAPLPGVLHLTKWIGTYGLSGVSVAYAGLLLLLVRHILAVVRATSPLRLRAVGRPALGMCLALACGALLTIDWGAPDRADVGSPLLHVVQPNIGQENKWDEAHSADNYRRLTSLSGTPGGRPRVIFWPEVAIPAQLEQDALTRRALTSLLGPRDLLLTGAETVRFNADGDVVSAANSLFAIDAEARILGRYDKSHLVPFGEYLPMRPILSHLGLSRLAPGNADFDAGSGPGNVTLPDIGAVGVQICYEIIFSGQVIDRANRPRFLFNPSNDAWFGRWGPPQHLAQARLRAAEEGMPIVRSTPTGISAIIDADGRLLASLPWRTAGAIELPLPSARPPTLFARFGNLLPALLGILLLAIAFASRRRAS
ncbi:apolipoprotein N-acyltransferase [Sphingomonas sp. ASY06-1R]|uniref:apolipoprotein N-acyltransferase n=1 Tax=Sphingomonas sp. ASY06-1R TaxID=3445771 RepID=UPI003FA30FCD